MYQKGEIIVYGNTGVCKVEDIGVPAISGVDQSKKYYTLDPVFESGKIYIPIDSKAFMRSIITKEEALKLIHRIPDIREEIIDNRNLNLLKEHYKTSLENYICDDLIQIIKTVSVKDQMAQDKGKKLGQVDKFYMKKAEEMLYGEFSIAFDMPKDDVKAFIAKKVFNDSSNLSAIN